MEAQKRYQNKREIWIENRSQNGRLGEAKPSVSPYTCLKIEVLGGRENLRKMGAKMDPKWVQNRTPKRSEAGFLRFWGVLEGCDFSMIFGTAKRMQKSGKIKHFGPQKAPEPGKWVGPAEGAVPPGR